MAELFEQILKDFGDLLKNFVSRRVSNPTDAEDILQEAYFKIYKNINRVNDPKKLRPWVLAITRNAVIDYYRKKDVMSSSTEIPEEMSDQPETDESFNTEISVCLRNMINDLPDIYKQAIIAVEFQGYTQKEASKRLGLTLSSVKSRVRRGRMNLKAMLTQCCQLEVDRLGNILDYRHKSNSCKFC